MEQNVDQEHLKLISIFHYIVGGVLAFFACIPLIHCTIGIAIMSGALADANNANQAPPEWFGLIFALIGGIFFVLGQALAWLIIYSGRQIKKRANYMFSFIVACVMCMFMPLGTILGIFTIIILSRESVKQLYEKTI
jgi:hypothetical protein